MSSKEQTPQLRSPAGVCCKVSILLQAWPGLCLMKADRILGPLSFPWRTPQQFKLWISEVLRCETTLQLLVSAKLGT